MILPLRYFLVVSCFSVALIGFNVYIKLHVYIQYLSNFLCQDYDEISSIYDYIVVGSGTAGSIISLRLSNNKQNRILLVEAGSYSNFLFDVPALNAALQRTDLDWQYETVPQRNACRAMKNNVCYWPMGKIFGGTHRLNNMLYVRNHRDDYSEWYKNYSNFDYDHDILPYFTKTEHLNNEEEISAPMHLNKIGFISQLSEAIINAARNLGLPIKNNHEKPGIGFMQPLVSTYNNKRFTSSDYLLHRKPSNLKIVTNALVTKILFQNNYEAYAVQFTHLGNNELIRAKKGIILSAGVIGTPKILQLSGVGPEKHLKKLKIRVRNNLPVGENLQDHVSSGLDLVTLNTTLSVNIETLASPFSMYNYFVNSKGPWMTNGCEAIGFCHTNYTFANKYNESMLSTRPNLQIMALNAGISSDGGKHLKNAIGIKDDVWEKYFGKLVDKQVISVIPVLLQPKSKGNVMIKNSDPYTPPLINPNYLNSKKDVKQLIQGIKFVKKMIATESMQKLGAKLNTRKMPGCETLRFDSNDYWECYVRHLTLTSYHPCCTCKMGDKFDKTAVVDYDFKVIGTNKLFVADASVMPSLPSSNANSVVAMIAEKVADIVKKIEFLMEGKCYIVECLVKSNICLL